MPKPECATVSGANREPDWIRDITNGGLSSDDVAQGYQSHRVVIDDRGVPKIEVCGDSENLDLRVTGMGCSQPSGVSSRKFFEAFVNGDNAIRATSLLMGMTESANIPQPGDEWPVGDMSTWLGGIAPRDKRTLFARIAELSADLAKEAAEIARLAASSELENASAELRARANLNNLVIQIHEYLHA